MKVAVTILAATVAALLGLGLVMLYSSSMNKSGTHDLIMQLVWVGLGFSLCVTATCLDYEVLNRVHWHGYGLAIMLLVLVFVPHVGHASHGAHRWLGQGGFRIQPSEFAKIALILVLAWYGDKYQKQMATLWKGVVLPVLIIAPILGLIFKEPDRGQTILLSSVCAGMLLVAGVRWIYLFLPVALGAAGLAYSLMHDHMRQGRIQAWLHPDAHANGAAQQAQQAMYGLGDGGWTGLGLGYGIRKFGYLPEIHTDFIFANIGEELGLVATLAVLVGFIIIALCGIYISLHARDTFGTLLALGLTLLICLQAAINIGVVTGSLPNKGLPLPFISYGGSNLLAMFICLGLLFSIARQGEATVTIAPAGPLLEDNPFSANPFAAKSFTSKSA
jgi:cell division protein FtsW